MKIDKIDSLKDAIFYHNKVLECEDEEIVLDFSSASFVRNNFISIIGLALELQCDKKIKIIEPNNEKIKNALSTIGFLSYYCDYEKRIDINNTMIQYTNIAKEDEEYYKFLNYFYKQLNRKVNNLSQQLKEKIMQKIAEQFSNVFRHSGSDMGFFCSGQFYPKKEEFYFTIVDNGVTIKYNVNQYFKKLIKDNKRLFDKIEFKEISGLDAIKWALMDTHSTTGSGGFGLSLLKELIIKSKARLEIVSGNGYYSIVKGEEYGELLQKSFNGTIVSVGLSTNMDKYFYLKGEAQND